MAAVVSLPLEALLPPPPVPLPPEEEDEEEVVLATGGNSFFDLEEMEAAAEEARLPDDDDVDIAAAAGEIGEELAEVPAKAFTAARAPAPFLAEPLLLVATAVLAGVVVGVPMTVALAAAAAAPLLLMRLFARPFGGTTGSMMPASRRWRRVVYLVPFAGPLFLLTLRVHRSRLFSP